jgi:hypothetical protein
VSIRTSTLRACLTGLVTGCLAACGALQSTPLTGAISADPEDTAIVEAATIDFMRSADCNEGSDSSGTIVEAKVLLPSVVFSWLRLSELSPDLWGEDLQEGLPNLRNRENPDAPVDWHFNDPSTIRDVVLHGILSDAAKRASALGKCATTFALPGLYANGQRATVVFEVWPEYHGNFVISSLRLIDGIWRVERRHTFVYL